MNRIASAVLLMILTAYGLSASREIGDFFVAGHEGWLGAQTGIGALNFLKHGFLKLKFCTTLVPLRPLPPTNPADYYAGHPMLNFYAVALLWSIVGVSELSARLYMILLTLGSIIFFFLLVRDLTRQDIPALLAAALYVCFPVVRYYGHQVNGEIGLLFFVAGGLFALNRHFDASSEKKRWLWFAIAAASWLAAFMMDWFSFVYGTLLLIGLTIFKPRQFRAAGMIALMMLLALTLFSIPVMAAKGSLSQVVEKFFFRCGQETGRYSYLTTLTDIYFRSEKHFGPVYRYGVLLAPLFALLWIKNWRDRASRFLILFAAAPLIFFLTLRQAVQIHDFFMIYFAFAFAFAPVWVLDRLLPFHLRWRNLIMLVCLLPVIMSGWAQSRFKPVGHANYAYLGRYLQHRTGPDDLICLNIDYPGPSYLAFYMARPIDPEYRLGDSGCRWVVLELRPENSEQIKHLLKKHAAVFYRNYFVFDLEQPPGDLATYRIEPLPSTTWYRYFISAERPPEDEVLVESPELARAIKIRLGLDKPPVNPYFPQGISGTYFRGLDFTGERRNFTGSYDRIDHVWVDSFTRTGELYDLKYLVRPWGGFSLRLAGQLVIPAPGPYRLKLACDDTAEVLIDEKTVLRTGWRQPAETIVDLTAGTHLVRIDFVDIGGEAFLTCSISPESPAE
jgi:hypothetical protein